MKRFLKFLVTGGLAAIVNVALRWLFSLAMVFELAVVLSYLIAMTVAFVLAKVFVFEASDTSVATQFLRFAMVNVVSLIVVWGVSVGLYRFVFPWMDMTFHPELTAHVIGVLSPVFVAYFLHKGFTFKNSQ